MLYFRYDSDGRIDAIAEELTSEQRQTEWWLPGTTDRRSRAEDYAWAATALLGERYVVETLEGCYPLYGIITATEAERRAQQARSDAMWAERRKRLTIEERANRRAAEEAKREAARRRKIAEADPDLLALPTYERNWAVWRARQATPQPTYAELGKRFGVVGTRAQQIVANRDRLVRAILLRDQAGDFFTDGLTPHREALRGAEFAFCSEHTLPEEELRLWHKLYWEEGLGDVYYRVISVDA